MATFKKILIKDIHFPARLRNVENDHVLVISSSITQHGLMNPITVRKTPNGEAPYTLVAGAHRLTAVTMLDATTIDCMVVQADALDAQLMEVLENLARNELSKLDRAIFVQTYRDIWEQKYGEIKRGNPDLPNCANIAQLIEDGAGESFSEHVADKLGLSRRSIENANYIAKNLPTDLREQLRGTPEADNQAFLLKVAKLDPFKREKAAIAHREAGGDTKQMFLLLDGGKELELTPQQKLYSRLVDSWGRADINVQADFLHFIGMDADVAKRLIAEQKARAAA